MGAECMKSRRREKEKGKEKGKKMMNPMLFLLSSSDMATGATQIRGGRATCASSLLVRFKKNWWRVKEYYLTET